jgi:hypothetical protein
MKKLFIHAGFAKCGSTSLQDFMITQNQILYPKSGINGAEHISLPLKVMGIDSYTLQFYQEQWVEANHKAMIEEINDSEYQTILISSERISGFSKSQALELKEIFQAYEVEIVFVKRSLADYQSSTWRHLVFKHDYAESFEHFKANSKNFSFDSTIEAFSAIFPVHIFNIDDQDYEKNLSVLLDCNINLGRSNTGISLEFANFLQSTHQRVGSSTFKKIFTKQAKDYLQNAFNSKSLNSIDPIISGIL